MKGFLVRAALAAALVLGLSGPAWAQPSMEWDDLFDGGALFTDLGTSAITDPQGNLVVAGESTDPAGGVDILVRKLDRSTAFPIWSAGYAAEDGNDVTPAEITWDGYGNVIVAGYIRGCVG